MMSAVRWRKFFWPELRTLGDATAACWAGACTLGALSGLHFVVTALHALQSGYGEDFPLFDASVLFAAAWGLHERSRFGPIAGLIYFLTAVAIGLDRNAFSLLVSFAALINGIRAVLAYHRFEKLESFPVLDKPAQT